MTGFEALAEPTRRRIVELLAAGERSAGEIVAEFEVSAPAISQHLKALREAGLVQVRQEAQRRVYAIDPGPLAELDVWLAPYRRVWNESLDALGRHLDKED